MLNTAFEPWPSFSVEEADAVKNMLLSNKVNYWTGQECREFEKEFAAFVGTKHAIALSNGTVAIEVALKALGIGHGDDVIVTSRTFIASASAIVLVGANPVFADVEIESQNISRQTIEAVLTPNTKAIICVHLAGLMCDMDPIMHLAEEKGIYVIEDCAQAHGARYKGKSAGSIGHINAWSFCQDKIITTGGEGGMVTTNNAKLWEKIWSYKDHGKSFDKVYNQPHPPGFRWLHDSFGSNLRMIEMQAVLGRMQLKKLPLWIQRRNENAHKILNAFANSQYFSVHIPPVEYLHAYYRCYVQVKTSLLPSDWTRDRLIQEFNVRNVPCFSGSCSEIYLEQAFSGTLWKPEMRLKNAQQLGETSLAFLVHPTLSSQNVEKTLETIEFIKKLL